MSATAIELTRDLLKEIQPRESVLQLARLMEFKLQKNARKGGNWPNTAYDGNKERDWSTLDLGYFLTRIEEETDELRAELRFRQDYKAENLADIALEAADVANFAMMIVDNIMNGKVHRE